MIDKNCFMVSKQRTQHSQYAPRKDARKKTCTNTLVERRVWPSADICRLPCVQLLYRPLGLGRWVTRFARCARLVHTRQPMGIDLWSERTAPPPLSSLSTPLCYTMALPRRVGSPLNRLVRARTRSPLPYRDQIHARIPHTRGTDGRIHNYGLGTPPFQRAPDDRASAYIQYTVSHPPLGSETASHRSTPFTTAARGLTASFGWVRARETENRGRIRLGRRDEWKKSSSNLQRDSASTRVCVREYWLRLHARPSRVPWIQEIPAFRGMPAIVEFST